MSPPLPPAPRRGPCLHAVVPFLVAFLFAAVRPLAAQVPFTNGQLATTVLGSASFRGFITSATLSHPASVAVDEASGKVYVADFGNHRVLRYGSLAALQSGQAAERVFGQADFGGMLGNRNRGTPDAATLRNPQAVAVDAAGRLYVVDSYNHRVLRFDDAGTGTTNGPDASRVFGQADFTSKGLNRDGSPGAGTMNNPRGVAVDAAGRLYVVDTGNHRVLRFDDAGTGTSSGPDANRVFGQADLTSAGVNRDGPIGAGTLWNPYCVAVDGSGRLYVSDVGNNRVLRFDGTGTTNGPDADRVFGQGDFTSGSGNRGGGLTPGAGTLSSPAGVAVDGAGWLFVADQANHRVLRFDDAGTGTTNGPDANRLFGQASFTGRGANQWGSTGAATLSSPIGVAVDGVGRLFVADYDNSRVLRFDDAGTGTTNGPDADRVLGHRSFTNGEINGREPGAMTLVGPRDVAVDEASGKVYVADSDNNRVLRYGSLAALQSGQAAERVFGQGDLTSAGVNRDGSTGAGTLWNPFGVAVDAAGRLYVADSYNHRVLRFDDAGTGTTNGPDADRVFGQADFTSKGLNRGGAVGAGTLSYPYGLAVDGAGRLFVADQANHRVLRFDDAATGTSSGPDANRVFGQADLTSGSGNRGGSTGVGTLSVPLGVAVEGSGRLYVTDYGNNRVLRFDDAGTGTSSGPDADRVFGQGDFTSGSSNRGGGLTPGAGTLSSPVDVAVDGSGRLYVTDSYNNRVLRFDDAGTGTTNGPDASGVLGQRNFTDKSVNRGVGQGPGGLYLPRGVVVDNATGQLFVADFLNDRVLVYKSQTGSLPVELASFTAAAEGRAARLVWTTASETNNVGFTVERQVGTVWTDASALIAGRGTTTERSTYAFSVGDLTAGTHTFRLRQTDTDGAVHHSTPLTVKIGVAEGLALTPLGTRGIRVETDGAAVVTVVDVLGRVVRTARVDAGTSEVRLNAVAAGVYLVRAEGAGGRSATTRLVVR